MTFRLLTGPLSTTAFAAAPLRPGALPEGTTWLLPTRGEVVLEVGGLSFPLRPGMFAVAVGGHLRGQGDGLAIHRPGPPGLFQVGGPIEPTGRLRYIDGCTDTLLTCPPRRGDPCLNHLHIPAGTVQSTHHHPSDRLGVIARGAGWCWTPHGRAPLEPGAAWHIPAGLPHHFETDEHALDVLAWHPDSDFGPVDDDHPMINRTLR